MDSQRTQAQPRRSSAALLAAASRREDPLESGVLLLGRYRLLEHLGAGGFGVVWRARDEELDRDVALKRVLSEAWGAMSAGEQGRSRARREALASARLTHPAIAALYEAREDGDALYLISELVEGDSLKSRIASATLTDREIIAIGLALCEALLHAHARGVIHRDVTPANVLVSSASREPGQATAKLTDFGNALLEAKDDPRTGDNAMLAERGEVLGTLAYMAPEQRAGTRAGPETDLYALALVLYEAFSGVNPLRTDGAVRAARGPLARLPSLELHRPDLPRGLVRAIDRALEPERARRGTVAGLADALQAAEEARPTTPWTARSARPRATPGAGERTLVGAPVRWTAAPPAGPRVRTAAPPQPQPPPAGSVPTPSSAAPASWQDPARGTSVPRILWWAGALTIILWQVLAGRPGLALVLAMAALPLMALPPRAGPGWLLAGLAPLLGLLGLAGAFPAIGGQAARWTSRAALGALGYWWLLLAQPLVGRELWLWPASQRLPEDGKWFGSVSAGAEHALRPLLTLATVEGILLWAAACALLPWLVRGRNVGRDIVLATAWSAALVAAEPLLDGGAGLHAAAPTPHGALLGAILGGAFAVCARALRGPVRRHAASLPVTA